MAKKKPVGWRGESERHAQAARRIKTAKTLEQRILHKATLQYLKHSEWKKYEGDDGFTAFLRREPDEKYWLMVNRDDLTFPVVGKPALLGLYDKDGTTLGLWQVPKFSTPEEVFNERKNYRRLIL